MKKYLNGYLLDPLTHATREQMARDIGKADWVADILEGKWDNTPHFRKLFGEMWINCPQVKSEDQ